MELRLERVSFKVSSIWLNLSWFKFLLFISCLTFFLVFLIFWPDIEWESSVSLRQFWHILHELGVISFLQVWQQRWELGVVGKWMGIGDLLVGVEDMI